MRNRSVRSRRLIAATISSVFAVVVLCLAGSVRAQETPRIGLTLRTVTAELRKQHNLSEDMKGALVTAVAAGSPAQEQGIVAGDVIVEVGGKPVDTTQAIGRSVAAASASGSVSFKLVNSKGERRDVTVPFPKNRSPILPGPK
jgi:S1-C subfamily serine protease